MSAQFVYEHKNAMAGLVLLGTSHPQDIDLSSVTVPIVKFMRSLVITVRS